MILIKSQREIELIRKSAQILVKTRKVIKDNIKEGISLLELDQIAEKTIISLGGLPAFKGYEGFPNTLCLSVNDTVVHGIPSDYRLKDGDIVSVDMGVVYQGYYSDSCVTFPVGKISNEVQKLLDVTKEAMYQGISKVRNGVSVGVISKAIQDYIKPYKYGIVREYTGHGIGKDLHEDPYIPNYFDPSCNQKLKTNMVICIEPMVNLGTAGINISDDGWTVKTNDNLPSAHFEHQVLVTDTGYEILSLDEE